MVIIGIGVLCIVGLGLAVFGIRFARAQSFIGYHQKIIDQNGGASAGTTQIIMALYRVVAGAVFAVTFVHFVLVLGPLWQGEDWARTTVLVEALLIGGTATAIPMTVERATGVRTAWRPAAVLTGLAVIGVGLTLIS